MLGGTTPQLLLKPATPQQQVLQAVILGLMGLCIGICIFFIPKDKFNHGSFPGLTSCIEKLFTTAPSSNFDWVFNILIRPVTTRVSASAAYMKAIRWSTQSEPGHDKFGDVSNDIRNLRACIFALTEDGDRLQHLIGPLYTNFNELNTRLLSHKHSEHTTQGAQLEIQKIREELENLLKRVNSLEEGRRALETTIQNLQDRLKFRDELIAKLSGSMRKSNTHGDRWATQPYDQELRGQKLGQENWRRH